MALTATMLLATFAVFDSMAVPLAADSTTDAASTFSSETTSSWTTDTSSSSTLTFATAAAGTTSGSAVSDSVSSTQTSVSASSTASQPVSSTSVLFSTGPADPSTTTVLSTAYASAPTVTVTAPPQTVTDTITIVPPPTPAPTIMQTAWSAPPQMTDLSAFSIQNFAYGHQNMRIIVNSPPPSDGNSSDVSPEALSQAQVALASAIAAGTTPAPPDANASAYLQLLYPANSINPAQEPQGGADFYATPLDLSGAKNISMEYSVFFPTDFDFVQAGKLPGIYGGHDGCSGGDDARECFSTRLMWRANGLGELYLYAPKDKQTDALCSTPPQSVCDAAWGLSIGRGSFAFTPGNWTHVRQTVTLNTPGKQDGGFALDVNGVRVIDRCDVYYRGVPQASAVDPESANVVPIPQVSSSPVAVAGSDTGLAGTQDDFIEGPFHLKVDSVLGNVNVGRDFTPAFAPPSAFAPYAPEATDAGSDNFTPAFAPPGVVPESPDVKVVDTPAPQGGEATTPTVTSTTTVMPATQTVTVYPTSTETAYTTTYASASPSDAPFSAASVADPPSPITFTGLFFSTFFGGHEARYATPKDQRSWFKDFAIRINS